MLKDLADQSKAWLQRVGIVRRQANGFDGKSGSLKPCGDLVGKAGALSSRRLVPEQDANREPSFKLICRRILGQVVAYIQVRLEALRLAQIEPAQGHAGTKRLLEIVMRDINVISAELVGQQIEPQLDCGIAADGQRA